MLMIVHFNTNEEDFFFIIGFIQIKGTKYAMST